MLISRQQIIDIFTAIKTAVEGTLTVGLPTGAATAAKQDTLIAKDFATQTTLAAVKTAVEGATPAGTNLIGKTGIDQTTDGTTNKVYVGNTANVQVTGSNAAVHESLTVDDTVGGKAFANYATNIYSFITAETAQMRFTVDGTAPTITVGHLLNPGDILELDSLADITAFRAIRTGSVSGVLKATYSGVA